MSKASALKICMLCCCRDYSWNKKKYCFLSNYLGKKTMPLQKLSLLLITHCVSQPSPPIQNSRGSSSWWAAATLASPPTAPLWPRMNWRLLPDVEPGHDWSAPHLQYCIPDENLIGLTWHYKINKNIFRNRTNQNVLVFLVSIKLAAFHVHQKNPSEYFLYFLWIFWLWRRHFYNSLFLSSQEKVADAASD